VGLSSIFSQSAVVRVRQFADSVREFGVFFETRERRNVGQPGSVAALDSISRVTRARIAVIVLLVAGAYFAAAPWLGCVLLLPFWRIDPGVMRICTFGGIPLPGGYGVPGFNGPYWGSLVVGVLYLAAAVWVGRRTRAL
jgi:hypothetical protein